MPRNRENKSESKTSFELTVNGLSYVVVPLLVFIMINLGDYPLHQKYSMYMN